MRPDVSPTVASASGIAPRTPRPRGALARRLFLTYLVLALFVVGLLSIGAIWAINTLEAHLQKIDMGMAVDRIRDDLLAGNDVKRTGRFFHGPPRSAAFPAWVRDAPSGFSKRVHAGRVWHAMSRDYAGERYLLLRDYTAFEQRQRRTHRIAATVMAGTLLLAFLLGAFATRRIVWPLLRLTAQMGDRPRLPPRTRLAFHYPDDEIGHLAVAFDAAYNQLEAALEREKLFTADVGHELRTPMMVISSCCDLLLDSPEITARHRAGVQRIQAAAQDVHQQLIAYLMLARGGSDANGFARGDIPSMVREEVARLRPRAAQSGTTLVISTTERDGNGDGLPTFPAALFRIVLSNLVRNAIQHAHQASRIVVEVRPDAIAVCDDGQGMSAETQANLFMPFVRGKGDGRGDDSKGDGVENLGLGLSLVQRICEHQQWRVSVTSSPHAGTRFDVALGHA